MPSDIANEGNPEAVILVEVTPVTEVSGEQSTGWSNTGKLTEQMGNLVRQATNTSVDTSFRTIYQMAERTSQLIRELKQSEQEQPSQVEVEFGLKFTSQGEAFVAKVAGEASIRVKLSWVVKDG
jgi:hypothetical protein